MSPSAKHVPTGERAARKRAAIVRAARSVFLDQGFASGMDQIAATAGVSKVTVYNHFSNKDELFTEVVTDALEQALGQTMQAMLERLHDSDDIRAVLVRTARGWVDGITRSDLPALRALIAAESRRFPHLGRAWRAHGPDRFAKPLAEALSRQPDLSIPDPDLAVMQYYSLVLYPHIVHAAYGDRLDADLTDRLITTGVDMFLTYYRTAPRP
ncbi:TetR/AcrR family transcriptional regulator [Actinocatenispora rupis]|uniref:Transcriptional regulator n=1 Tax=Actinocatenispora rupis TaxID=519421 RepID=A0A8J3NDU9_9ACTN|nr:TetR/AcrR family transcriptional regulator [Actinocatenispora rupis]GID15396.1 transcriptional regulator [Actinocatenispora rupis]